MQFLLRHASSDAFLSGGQSADAPPYHGLRVADVPGDTPVDVAAFEREAKRILAEVEAECGWMYETLHVEQASSLRNSCQLVER